MFVNSLVYFCLMRFIKPIFDFYIDASIHVALAVLSFFCITCIWFNIPHVTNLDFVIFLGTIVMYNFMKYGSRAKKYIFVNVKYEKVIQLFSFITGLLLVVNLFCLSITSILILAVMALLSLLYILPFTGKGVNLRSFSTMKIYVVALVWAVSTVILPFGSHWSLLTENVWISLVQRFLMVTVLILPFEIRDMESDAASLITIPRKIGVDGTKKLGYLMLGILLMLELLKMQHIRNEVFALLFFVVITALFLKYTKAKQSVYYTKFWVESIPVILWGFSELLIRFF